MAQETSVLVNKWHPAFEVLVWSKRSFNLRTVWPTPVYNLEYSDNWTMEKECFFWYFRYSQKCWNNDVRKWGEFLKIDIYKLHSVKSKITKRLLSYVLARLFLSLWGKWQNQGLVVLGFVCRRGRSQGSQVSRNAYNNSRELKEKTENIISWYVILQIYCW